MSRSIGMPCALSKSSIVSRGLDSSSSGTDRNFHHPDRRYKMATLQDLINRDKDIKFRPLENIEREKIVAVEGRAIPGAENIIMHTLFATDNALVLHSVRKKGYTDPPHQHNDHDTINFLASGKMRVHIG